MAKFTFLLLSLSFLLFSCNSSQEKKTPTNSSTTESSQLENSNQKIGRTNYAVVWKWTTDDPDLVVNNSPQISKELTDLFKADVVENAYYDSEAKVGKLDYFPNITFFLKAQNKAEAKSILNKLTVVTKGIATYKLHPVGQLWLDRKTELAEKKGNTKSFVVVSTTSKSPLQGENSDELLKRQNDTVLELWNSGIIENVYFDIEGTYKTNNKTDFVFFVNGNSEKEARSICDSLPFFQEKIATYELFQVGVFWMGKYKDN